VQDGNGYDVLLGLNSMKERGEFAGGDAGENPVHLVLNSERGIEHFLFDLNLDGSGELLWSSAEASALTTCHAAPGQLLP
jgi:hypothetical protein